MLYRWATPCFCLNVADFSFVELNTLRRIYFYVWLSASAASSLVAKSVYFILHYPQHQAQLLANKHKIFAKWLGYTGEGQNYTENRNWLTTLF